MELHTCSEVISFARKLEEESAAFYENLAQKQARDKETLLSFAAENKKNIVQIERAYYGVISDALEGCFAFSINPAEYEADLKPSGDAMSKAVAMEDNLEKFYLAAAEQAKSLMADVPRAFTLIARKRKARTEQLKALSGKSK